MDRRSDVLRRGRGPGHRSCVPFGWPRLFRGLGAQRPGGPPARRGPHFSREMGRKRAGGKPPGPRVLWPLVATRWVWGSSSLIRSKGYFVRYAKTDLGRIFREKFYRFSDYLFKSLQMSERLGISSISGILRFGRYPAYHGISEPHLAVKSSKSVVENRPYY